MDEVFGEPNFVAQVVVNLNPKGRQLGKGFATIARVPPRLRPGRADLRARREQHRDGRRARLPADRRRRAALPAPAAAQHQQEVQPRHRADPALHGVGRPGDRAGRAPRRSPARGRDRAGLRRRHARGVALEPAADRRAARRPGLPRGPGPARASGSTSSRRTGCTRGRRKKLRTIWLAEEVGSTDTAVAELKEIVGHVFESPKPTGLVRRILGTMPDDARVLDFFAGSGTTGHAVALQNAEDGGTRRCVSVNSAEPTREGSNARNAGYLTVADITRARLRAVAARGWGPAGRAVHDDPMTRRVALVTGGSSGIGEQTARGCARPTSRCTPWPAASTGWPPSRSRASTSSRWTSPTTPRWSAASTGSSPSAAGSTYWSTTPATARTARSRTCRSTRPAASSRSTSSAWPG